MSAIRILPLIFLLLPFFPQAQANHLILPNGHENGVSSIKFTKDGKKLISASFDQTIRVWDFASGSLLKTIFTGDPTLGTLFLSPDETYAVGTSSKSSINVWDIKTGQSAGVLSGHGGAIYVANFSPDGRKILTGSIDNTAIIWSMPEGKILFQLKGHKKDVDRACFSPDGRLVATSSYYDSTTRIWNVADGRFMFELPGGIALGNRVFSNDSKRLLTSYLNSGYEWTTEGKKIHEYKEDTIVRSISYNSTCMKVLIHTARPSNIVRDVKSGEMETKLEEDSQNLYPSFSPDDRIIMSFYGNKDIALWDAKSGKLLPLQKKLHKRSVYGADFSPDSRYVASASEDSSIIIRETNTGGLVHKLESKVESILDFKINNNGKNLVTTLDGKACVWDFYSGQNTAEMKDRALRFKTMDFSSNGKDLYAVSSVNTILNYDLSTGLLKSWKWMLPSGQKPPAPGKLSMAVPYGPITISADKSEILSTLRGYLNSKDSNFSPGKVLIWSRETGEPIYEYHDNKQILCANQSLDKKRIVIGFEDSTILLIDRETGNNIVTFKLDARCRSVSISPDNNWIFLFVSGRVTVWNVITHRYFNLIGHNNYITSMEISADGSKILTASADQTARVWDAKTGRMLMTISDSSGEIKKALYTPDGSMIITQTATNLFIAWNANNGIKLYSFYPGDHDHSFIQLPSGYYLSSPEYSKLLHYVTPDQKVLSFESLDVKYNRPDKVLEAIGNTDTALIKSYRKAWEKRIKKLGIDTTAFRDGYSVPEAEFTNRDIIEYEQKNGTLALHIKGIDSTYKLDRFNVWVNEAPVFGQRGINIRKRSKNNFDTTISIKLSQGENRIETSITNVNGTESYRMPLIVNYTPAVRQKETTHFIGIGIDQFAHNQYNLQYSSKDIRDLSRKLKEKYKEDIIIDTLFNENVTESNVKALKQKLLQTTENDKVIVAYSGHGMLSKDYDYYLSTYSINFDNPEENGLPYDELENLLDSIPARKKLMLIDACHSGEVDKEDLVTLNISSDSLIKGLKPVAYKQEGHLGLKNSFELMQSLFVNVGKSTGATIISAAAGTQFALERNDLKNGVFTYSILEAMKKYPTLKISELKKIVGERVEQLTNGLQKPTSRNETIAVNWNVW